tara:strand:- start:1180 stop:1341 length:162 start_codon:yes stop_codon:yes gene_type:complete
MSVTVAFVVLGVLSLAQMGMGLPVTSEGLPQALLTALGCGIIMSYLTGEPEDD